METPDLKSQQDEIVKSLSQDVYKILFDYMIKETKNDVYRDSIIQNRIYEFYSPAHLLCIKEIIANLIDLIGKYCKENDIPIDDVSYNRHDPDDLTFVCYDYLVDMSIKHSCLLLYPVVLDKLYHGMDDFKDFKDFKEDDDPIPKFSQILHDTIIQIVFDHFEWKYTLEANYGNDSMDDDQLEKQKNILDDLDDLDDDQLEEQKNILDDLDKNNDFSCMIS